MSGFKVRRKFGGYFYFLGGTYAFKREAVRAKMAMSKKGYKVRIVKGRMSSTSWQGEHDVYALYLRD